MRMDQGMTFVRVLAASGALFLFGGALECVAAEELEASFHPVNAAAKRVDESMSYGSVKFTPGSKDKEVNVLVQINNMPVVSEEEPLTVPGGPTVFPHAFQIRAVTTCEDTATDKSLAGELPDIQLRTDGSATLEVKAEGISMSDLPGKTAVIYRGKSTKEKRDIMACGVIGPKKK
jgi:hypothetical protein